MNDETTNLDQIDEEILTSTVSDEILETAAGMPENAPPTYYATMVCACSFPGDASCG
jgi:hypothetical protein